MNRTEALEHLHKTVRAYDENAIGIVRWVDVRAALGALDAIPPATEPEPQLRAVSMAITPADGEGMWTRHVVMSDGSLWDQIGGEWKPVPLPSIPEVVGEVEG